MSFSNRWAAFAARLGTSPRQLAILLASAMIAIGIFGGKLVFAPKSATAAVAAAAPAMPTKVAEPTAAAIPDVFMKAIPRWNLAANPARSPFTSPDDLRPAANFGSVGARNDAPRGKSGLDLQATLDRAFAVVNGKAIRIGESWTDNQSGITFRLVDVGERSARFSTGRQTIEVSLDD